MIVVYLITGWAIINWVLFIGDLVNDCFVWEKGVYSDRVFDLKDWFQSTVIGKVFMVLELLFLVPYHIFFLISLFCKRMAGLFGSLIETFRVNHLGVDFDFVPTFFKSVESEEAFYKMLETNNVSYKKFQDGVKVLTRNATMVGVFYQRAINGLS